MANAFTASHSMMVGEMDTLGGSTAIRSNGARYVDIALNFSSNGFTGQIDLQGEYRVGASNAYDWLDIENYTGDTVKVARVATSRRLRLNCSTQDPGNLALVEMTVGNKD